MMSRKELDLWVGIFVAMGFGAFLFLALKVAGLSSFSASQTYEVIAKFDNIGGLKRSAPIKSAGVVVGRVVDISFDAQTFEAATVHLRYGIAHVGKCKLQLPAQQIRQCGGNALVRNAHGVQRRHLTQQGRRDQRA